MAHGDEDRMRLSQADRRSVWADSQISDSFRSPAQQQGRPLGHGAAPQHLVASMITALLHTTEFASGGG